MFFSVCDARMLARLDRVLLGRQAEGVEAHRVHHAPALHPRRAAHDVGRRVTFRMPHVQPVAAGVRKHVERVELLRARLRQPRRGKRLVLLPIRLPLGLDRGVVVAGHREEDGGQEVGGQNVVNRLRFSSAATANQPSYRPDEPSPTRPAIALRSPLLLCGSSSSASRCCHDCSSSSASIGPHLVEIGGANFIQQRMFLDAEERHLPVAGRSRGVAVGEMAVVMLGDRSLSRKRQSSAA